MKGIEPVCSDRNSYGVTPFSEASLTAPVHGLHNDTSEMRGPLEERTSRRDDDTRDPNGRRLVSYYYSVGA